MYGFGFTFAKEHFFFPAKISLKIIWNGLLSVWQLLWLCLLRSHYIYMYMYIYGIDIDLVIIEGDASKLK